MASSAEGDCGFERDAHVQYLVRMLHELPAPYQGQETNRLSIAYFVVSGLDILGALNEVSAPDIIDWVYSLQVLPLHTSAPSCATTSPDVFGFRGSNSVGIQYCAKGVSPIAHDGAHLAMTYSALALLRILGDDFSKIFQANILASMRLLQQPDGSFSPVRMGGENDMRFIFCAAAICAMLDDWSGMDLRRAVQYIFRSQSYDAGFGLAPGLEAHGGATYCAIATLMLARNCQDKYIIKLFSDDVLKNLIEWCVQRQVDAGGFQGRSNKDADTCYAFWVGGSLQMLEADCLCAKSALRSFLLSCQSKWGGFSKRPHEWPDVLHAYYGICGFSLLGEAGLQPICYEVGLTRRACAK